MIKLILWVVLFFALLAVVPFVIGEKGYILIAMGDITIESTVVTAVLLLVLSFISLMLLLKLTRGSVRFSATAWHKIAFAGKRRGQRELRKGMAAYLLDDYQQAEHLLAKSAEPSGQAYLAYLTAAKAAHQQQKNANTDHYLQLAQHQDLSLKETSLESVLVHLDLLMARDELQKARKLIDDHHKHIGHDPRLLALEIELCLKEQRFEQAIEHITKAAKQKTLADKITSWQQQAFIGRFSEFSGDELDEYWRLLGRKTKNTPVILIAYCQRLAELGKTSKLEDLLLPALKKGSDEVLINAIKQLPIKQTEGFIKVLEGKLQKQPDHLLWLSTLAHLAYQGGNNSLAEKAFNSLKAKQGNLTDNEANTFARVLVAQGKHEQAARLLLA